MLKRSLTGCEAYHGFGSVYWMFPSPFSASEPSENWLILGMLKTLFN